MTERNRRHAPRFTVERIAEIMVRGYSIEFPTRDISTGGVCLDSLGVTQLRPGDICFLVLDGEDEVQCEVVEITRAILRLKFLDSEAKDVLRHFGLAGAETGDTRPVIQSL